MDEKRLYRSRRDSLIAGVCGGLGEYFNTDPVIFRILFVLAILFGGGGVLVYIILWIVIPQEKDFFYDKNNNNMETNEKNINEEPVYKVNDESRHSADRNNYHNENREGSLWGGVILITIGAVFLIDRFVPHVDFGDLWPLILIAIGAILILKSVNTKK